jgi:hypothetical protein
MVNVASLFNQLLKQIPRIEFDSLVRKHRAERGAKGFGCWTQLVSMLFCQLAQTESLREICNGLKCCMGKLAHLGLNKAPVRSTLSYANQHRTAALFEDLFWSTLHRFRQNQLLGTRPRKFRFKNKLLSMDSTTISLCLGLFPWAGFKRSKGAVKAHTVLDHDDYMPRFIQLTTGKTSDVRAARRVPLPTGSIVVCDRGYLDFTTYTQWDAQGVFFVCRSPFPPLYKVLAKRQRCGLIIDDQIVQYTGRYSGRYKNPVRRITVKTEDKDPLILITNHMDFAASTIVSIYKERWKIEVFFKTLKQNLKIKTFVGTSENALRIQIWTALLAMILLRWLHHLSKARWSLSILAYLLHLNLFTYRDLQEWLNDPYETPPQFPQPKQLLLDLMDLGQPHLSEA